MIALGQIPKFTVSHQAFGDKIEQLANSLDEVLQYVAGNSAF
jgi:hypothetical protein